MVEFNILDMPNTAIAIISVLLILSISSMVIVTFRSTTFDVTNLVNETTSAITSVPTTKSTTNEMITNSETVVIRNTTSGQVYSLTRGVHYNITSTRDVYIWDTGF